VTTPDGSVVFRTDLDHGIFRDKVLANLPKDAAILEYGCGRGRILSRLAKDGFTDLTAHDVGRAYRAPLARIVGPDRVFLGERPTGRTYDLLCSFFAFEHDPEPGDGLRYLRSVAAPNATLYVVVPSYGSNPGDLACADHRSHFSAAVLAELVTAAGFSVLEVDEQASLGALVLVAKNLGAGNRPVRKSRSRVQAARAHAQSFLDYLARLERLAPSLAEAKDVYFYGAGFYAALAATVLPAAAHLAGVFDANPKKHGTVKLGATVQSPDAIAEGCRDGSLLVCVNERIAPSIAERYRAHFRAVWVV
jgi:SAM-dependent methyltransferase